MKYNQKINLENIKKFSVSGIFFDTDNKKFKCVLCERKVAISGSTSIGGHFLICNNCAYEKFGDYAEARKWQQQEFNKILEKEQNNNE